MTAKNKLPPIRFKGFHGEWKNNGFSVTFTNIPNNTLSRDELNYNFGLAKNIHYGDVLIKFGELLDIQKEEIPFISNSDYVNKLKSSKLQNGDIVIADAAEDEIVGKCTEITNIEKDTVLSGLHTIAVRPTQSFASKYLGYYMNSSSYHNQLLPLLQGTKVLSISKSVIKKTIISYPKDPLEQTKIGNYFQNLNKLIEQKEKKYQKLGQLKKAILEKMFPKEGATTPEIRFKGFSGEWEEKRIEEIVDVIDGDRGHNYPNGDELQTIGHTLFLSASNVTVNGFKFVNNQYITELKSESMGNGKLIENDIVLTSRGSIGHIAWYNKEIMQQVSYMRINSGMLILRTLGLINSSILTQLLKSPLGKKKIDLISFGSAQPQLTKKDVSNNELIFPLSKLEQTKIGNYFQKLDYLIELQDQELQKLKNIKKASLAKMFV